MVEKISVSIDDWIYEEIERLRTEKNRSRSEVVAELLIKGLNGGELGKRSI